ncbi:MAG: PilC/PilY family type IV pilus protein [Pseudomonadota bacterium]
MNTLYAVRKILLLCLSVWLAFAPYQGLAEDIDIFVGSSAGSSDAPNVMILLDNSPNWSRNSQHWPDDDGNQGESEVLAISSVLNAITSPVNVGLAMLTDSGPDGGYIRFGTRDVSIAANRTAFKNILNAIDVNAPSEKVNGMAHKDESAGFYEVYKYFWGLSPYAGAQSHADLADVSGNSQSLTAWGQGLRSGFAINSTGTYNTPISASKPCAKNYIIYIANNANNTGSSGLQSYEASGISAVSTLAAPSGTLVSWTDEWAKTLYNNGVTTYVLDAYNEQQNTAYSLLLQNAAKMGGGSYTQVSTKAAIVSTLLKIFAEIQTVNTAFAAASLPVNATNRAQNQNQVFIGMFRPDGDAKPRWFGNMKRYQLINNSGSTDLGDVNGNAAVNTQTGFLTACATSYWTNDSDSYWSTVPINPLPSGTCPTTSYNAYSDSPDGPFVEKGGAAEVLRQGNNPPTTTTTPTWAVNRTVYTLSSSNTLTPFTTTSSGLSSSLVNFVKGQDVNDENSNGNLTETRPSLHGDVIHSRPLPVTYSGSTGVVVYYGSNDGSFRAVNASTGQEQWAFVAPEFFSKLQRQSDNSPLVSYPNLPSGLIPTPTPKDYFFDGSTGIYQNADNTNVWIYPTMRRGGRMIYALNVTNSTTPAFKWKVGCPNLSNNTGCTSSAIEGIGQTWSTPNVAFIKGYSTSSPVIVVGGGYDACEDTNSISPTCTTPKGAAVYVLDANTGSILATFSTTRSVAADVSLVDLDLDGYVDYAYAADTGGNIYRIDFINGPSTRAPLPRDSWVINKVAYTNGSGRKFLFGPALLANTNKVYVAVGSGDREHPLQTQYPYTSPVTNRFYVYLDDLAASSANNLDDLSTMLNYSEDSSCSTGKILPTSSSKGWFMNLRSGVGEQTVTSALIISGMVTFNTNRPIPAASGTCSTALGEARGYWLNLLNASGAIGVSGSCGGTKSSTFTGGGLPPSPVFGVVPVNGVQKTIVIGASQKDGGASAPIASQQIRPAIKSIRKKVYWHSSGNK